MAVILDRATAFTQLTGTTEADTFIFLEDGNQDGLRGFQDGSDKIDLSRVSGLAFEDLTIRDGALGRVFIEYESSVGPEKITMHDNEPGFRAADLTADDFVFAPPVQTTRPDPTNTVTDNAGRFNILQGTAHADRFLLVQDGNPDGISGYEDDKDLIDLSGFGLGGFGDLSIRDGFRGRIIIEYDSGLTDTNGAAITETLTLHNSVGGITSADLTAEDFAFDVEVPIVRNIIEDPATRFSRLDGTNDPDTFVFGIDGNRDAINGYVDGEDLIDLSAVAGLTFADLNIRDGVNGRVSIQYENGQTDTNGDPVVEAIMLRNNQPDFIAADLTADDFIFA